MRNDHLAKARHQKNLSQSELAEKLGCSKQAVSNWETGYSNPPLKMALKISEILDRDVDYLFGKKVQDSQTKKEVC
ncbi:helix-turn-helix domain-containing protein [Bacillus coagulans]|uniref:helix-turn-helix transcriptional regulator n=1 Tax=Heyndrickxia TaxID=2837504 RepID=UPI000779889B|nr:MULTISPECIES: helix-turn-helix transcriptional regulator [Heyndrickxia]APB37948.1 transcriptional regulator [Heyndrickxia coagulans]MEC2222848.1 helix-turn-helix transcriptional regulator [Weizmannia sp. CD-2023]NCG67102.1 helix-turn-helix domain-containing protein [Heyndrickxia coagulans]WNE61771.1 helix-turn-helix transcriptional regulator [Heyndrickxia coagulans]